MLDLFSAVKVRYNATDLKDNFTGISAGEAPPDTPRPYLVAMPNSETRTGRSNVGGYFGEEFSIQVIATEFEQATGLAYLLQDRLLVPPMGFIGSSSRLLLVEEADLSWFEEDGYWRVQCNFRATVGKPGRPRG